MRVPTLSISDGAIAQIQNLTATQTQLQKQASTGQRIFLPEDDPAAMNRLLSNDNQGRQIAQYQTNATTALNLAQSSYAGLNQFSSLASRAGELATLGSGVNGATSNQAYATELNQLIDQAIQTGNSQFNGNYLFAGTALTTTPYVATRDASGQVTSVTYAGDSNQSTIALSSSASVSPGTSGATNSGLTDFINNLVALRDALNTGDPAAISSAGSAITASETTVTDAISENGAAQLRIQAAQSQLTAAAQNVGQLVSTDSSADLPSTIVKLNEASTAYQAALSSSAKLLQSSLLDYIK